MSRAVAADVKATGRDRTVITKAGKRSFFYGFRSNVKHFSLFQTGRYALFGLDFGAVPSFRATVFPRHGRCVFSLGRQQQEQQEGSMSHCTNSDIKIGRKL